MSPESEDDQRRDDMLLRALRTPPQPRKKRDRGAEAKPKSGGVESLLGQSAADH